MPFDPQWETIHQTVEWSQKPDLFLLAFLEQYWHKISACRPRFLDLGCGTGASTRYLAGRYNVLAVDGSITAINKLSGYTRMCRDITNLKLPNLSIDIVVDICCLQHLSIEDASKVLEKARTKWLRRGGLIVSKMATMPYDLSLSRTSNIRMTEIPEIKQIFSGYNVTYKRYTEYPDDTRPASHWYIHGGI